MISEERGMVVGADFGDKPNAAAITQAFVGGDNTIVVDSFTVNEEQTPAFEVIDEQAFIAPEQTKRKPKLNIFDGLVGAALAKGDTALADELKRVKKEKNKAIAAKAEFKAHVVNPRRKKAKAAKKSKKANRK